MTQPIRVVIVDDIPETREHLTKLLGFETDIEVAGAAGSGLDALDLAVKLRPDVVLMDINMPGMDGIATTEQLSASLPSTAIVMMSVQGEADYLRRSMLAGAREFLVKPFSSDELVASIRQVHRREREKLVRMVEAPYAQVHAGTNGTGNGNGNGNGAAPREPGKIIAVFSPKGGVGRTTIAVNLAVAAANAMGKNVVIVDASFQFGDVGVLLNLNPKNKSIADLVPEMGGEPESLDQVLVKHSTGVDILLAPPTPEVAELITTTYLKKVLAHLRSTHDVVVVDCWPWIHETTLGLLDDADVILALLTLEITNIKNMRLFLEVAEQLGYAHEKVKLVLNRADAALGIRIQDVEASIGRKIDHTIVSDGRSVVYALNRGVPFFTGNPQAQVSQDILRLARSVIGDDSATTAAAAADRTRKSLFARR